MSIPIRNIYYLLCYAWNRLQEKELVESDNSDYELLPNLLAKVLVNGCNRIAKQGLDHSYVENSDLYNGIKGKLDFTQSIKTQTFLFGKAYCAFDEFTPDITTNQLLKGTLQALLKINDLDADIKEEVKNTIQLFAHVSNIVPRTRLFRNVRIHRNNGFYAFLLSICELIIDNTNIDEKSGIHKFRDVARDQQTMQYLYEEFVRNFYREKQSIYTVKREVLAWQAFSISKSGSRFLPSMITDTSLISSQKRIIIDTKYYQETLTSNQFSHQKFHSNNLYQIFSYVKNAALSDNDSHNRELHGILLYPTTCKEISETYSIEKHLISVFTINLAAEWREIERRLLEIIGLA